jgi:hypothetical protein
VYYDMKFFFAPYINKKIKYYNLPHIYKVVPSFGHIAICQYKVDCSMPHWNPHQQPKDTITDMDNFIAQLESTSILIPELAAINGPKNFLQFLGLGDVSKPLTADDLLRKKSLISKLNEANTLLPTLEQLSLRMHDEADGVDVKRMYDFRNDIQRKMMNQNCKTEGYIIWLDLATKKWYIIIVLRDFLYFVHILISGHLNL